MRQRDDGQVRAGLRQVAQRARGVSVQEIELAGIALGAQRGMQRRSLRRLRCGVARLDGKDDDRLGRQQGRKIVFVHGPGLKRVRALNCAAMRWETEGK